MSARTPGAASGSSPIPSLAALRRAGVVTVGAVGAMAASALALPHHSPGCADTREGELQAHGHAASTSLLRGYPGEALREIALAVGLIAHTQSGPGPGRTAGEMMSVGVTPVPQVPVGVPPQPPDGVVLPRGATPPVTVVPPQTPRVQPPPPRVRPAGAAPRVIPGGGRR